MRIHPIECIATGEPLSGMKLLSGGYPYSMLVRLAMNRGTGNVEVVLTLAGMKILEYLCVVQIT